MKRLASLSVCVALLWSVAAPLAAREPHQALRDYVTKKDDSYKWVKRSERQMGGVTVTELTLTSQTWRGIPWKHQLLVLKPKEVQHEKQALLLVSGGDWSAELEQPPKEGDKSLPGEVLVLAQAVNQMKSPVAVLNHVPHQPIFEGLVEDQIIAYTFDQFLKTSDPEWPLLLPMVKSAVRAMDAIQEFAKQEWSLGVESFTVTGASKRGWTTWLTGAVDKRATAIAPMVIDTLNIDKQMQHQLATWGEYSVQIEDYTKRGIQGQNQTPQGKALSQIVDPYTYLADLEEPKLLVMGTNDEYWCLDALSNYWDDLKGEKRILYVPNKGHDINDMRRVVGTVSAFHKQACGQLKLPVLTWKLAEQDGKLTLTVNSDVAPKEVSAWISHSDTKDFRKVRWEATPAESAGGAYQHVLDVPSSGYAAMFGEAVYEHNGQAYFLSTSVKIVGQAPAAAATGGAGK